MLPLRDAVQNNGGCLPLFILLGLLIGSMYAAGMDPLKTFDITSPHLPGPKPRPMTGVTQYMPGWKVQRLGQLRARKELDRILNKRMGTFRDQLDTAGRNRKKPIAPGLVRMLEVHKRGRNRDLLNQIMKSRELTTVQKSLLIEVLYMGGAGKDRIIDIEVVTGMGRTTIMTRLVAGERMAFRLVRKHMDHNWNTRRMLDIRRRLKAKVGTYENELDGLTDSEKNMNKSALEAWGTLTWLTGSEFKGVSKAGLREAKEQADNAYEASLRFTGLDGKIGRFMAKTPLLGDVATAVGSVKMVTGVYGRVLRTAVVDGIGLNALRAVDRRETGVAKAYKERFSVEMDKISVIGDGYLGMAVNLRAVIGELKRRAIRSGRTGEVRTLERMFKKSETLHKKSRKLIDDCEELRRLRGRRKEQKRQELLKRAKVLQGEFGALVETMMAYEPMREALEEQYAGERTFDGTESALNIRRSEELVGVILWGMREIDLPERTRRKMDEARAKLDAGEYSAALQFAETIVITSMKREAKFKKGVERIGNVMTNLGKGQYGGDRLHDRALTLFVDGAGGVLDTPTNDVKKALKAIDRRMSMASATEKKMLLVAKRKLERMEKKLEGHRDGINKMEKGPGDVIESYGYLGDMATARINRLLDEEHGELGSRDLLFSKEEMEKMLEKTRAAAGVGGVSGAMEGQTLVIHQHMNRKHLVARINKLLKEGKTERLNDLYEEIRLVGMHEMLGSGTDRTPFELGSMLGKKDVMLDNDPKIKEFKKILKSRGKHDARAEQLANLFVESFPWYRKMKGEYIETFVKHLSGDDSYMVMSKRPEYENIERTDFLGTNLMETVQKLEMWKLSNEESVARGLIPGTDLTIGQAKDTGAWVARPEGYWIPLTSKNAARNREMESIRANVSEADKIMFGYIKEEKGKYPQIVDSDGAGKKEGGAWEKAWASGLYDPGMKADAARA
ncbi:MAG: hypothetical protein ABIG39_07445, partial [Candidatus Micrarchaeota archaeon]